MFLYLLFFAGKQKAQAVQSPENGNQEKGHQSQRVKQLNKGADCEGAQKSQLGDAEAAKGSAVHPQLLRLVALAFPLGGKTERERIHLFKAWVHPLDHVDVGNLHPGVQRQKEQGSSGADEDVSRVLVDKGYSEEEEVEDEDQEETGDSMKLTSIQSITDFMNCAGRTLPDNIRLWARRNLAVARSHEVSPEERRHAQRALSMMMNIQWKSNYFEAIDPVEARRILDEELYGMERVKQRIIETIIQINRTHTLPAYGLLLIGPAGTGKSQIAYAVARILKLPWTTLDMSSINDPEQLTGSSRIYANAKPGIIMDAFSMAGESNLVFIINELDKAASGKGNGNPADVLLTLLDNLGFTDNYIECMIPTVGVYPIATANDKDQISAPLMSRFAVIEIPDYTPEEKKIIFSRYALPKVLKRIGMKEKECILTPEGLDAVISCHENTSGIRDLEQAAEHIAANALYQIEVNHVSSVTFDAEMVRELLLSC